jgi:hypothetical protein
MTISFRWQPGQLIPTLMILTVIAEAMTRFLPASSVSTRGTWEAAIRYSLAANVEAGRFGKTPGLPARLESAIDPRDPRQGSFEINLNLENQHAFGNLASMGNLPQYRRYHVEDFTTDEFGFRNRPGSSANRPPGAMVLGSSYIAQPGVVYDQTLPAVLAARSGQRVYNAATSGGDPEIIGDFLGFIRRTARRLGMSRGLVILDYKAGEDYCIIEPGRPGTALSSSASQVADATRPWAAGLRRWLAFSRLKVLAQRAYKSLENDWLLPNVHAHMVLLRRLPDGETMLFLPPGNPDVQAISGGTAELIGAQTPTDRRVRATASDRSPVNSRVESLLDGSLAYFKWLNAQLRTDGLTLVVLFVPRPIVVYGDLVEPAMPAEAWVAYYQILQARLEAEAITVVNPVEVLRREARARLAKSEYLYQLDDTHWSPQGIAIAVDEILRVLPSAAWPETLPPGHSAKPGGTENARPPRGSNGGDHGLVH